MQTILLYTDGGARGNPGPAGAGWVIYDGDPSTGSTGSSQAGSGRLLAKSRKFLGEHRTNNWAEYEAVVLALQEVKKRGLAGRPIEVRMDSELIQRQLTNEYQIKEETLWPQYMKVHNLVVAHFPDATFVHISREMNMEADRLVNEAIDENTNN